MVGQHDADEYYDGHAFKAKYLPHPDYEPITNEMDFMLVLLLDGIVENVNVVRLDSDPSFINQNMLGAVVGWGDVVADH